MAFAAGASAKAMSARLFREPLTHFALAGALILLAVTGIKAAQRPVIRISATDLHQMAAYWRMQSQRPPTDAELKGMVRDRIDEEILAHEARRLGLDRDDLIIRRRLAQKMLFAGEETAAPPPNDAALRGFYARTAGQYLMPAKVTLRHLVFIGDQSQGRAAAALAATTAGQAVTGDAFMLPTSYADATPDDLAKDYGVDFSRAVISAPLGHWSGPVRSAYGWHILRVEARAAPQAPSFDQVKSEVRDAYLLRRREEAAAATLRNLRQSYRIEVTPGGG